jgi:hypothetical protein
VVDLDEDLASDRVAAASDDFDAALLAPAFFDLNESDRIKVIRAFSMRATPEAPIKKTLGQLSVATDELTRALMKRFAENRRPEVTRLLHQITGLDEVRCGQIAHDSSGAALFVVLRAFGSAPSTRWQESASARQADELALASANQLDELSSQRASLELSADIAFLAHDTSQLAQAAVFT